MRDHTTTGLIDIIAIRGMVPIAQDTFPNDKILDIATDEIRSVVVPSVLATNEEWFLTSTTETYARSIPVPTNAISGSLRDIQLVKGNRIYSIPRLSVEDINNSTLEQNPIGFIIEDTTIKFYGEAAEEVILRYYASPGALALVEDCAKVVSSSYNSGLDITTITTDTNPEDWTDDFYIDTVSNLPFYKTKITSVLASVTSTTTITLVGDYTTDLVAGDWITVTGTSPIPQVPQEWLPYVAQAVVSVIMEAQGDIELANKSTERQNNLKKSLLQTIAPRVRGEAKKIVAVKNRRS
jgi:hypothetical protein